MHGMAKETKLVITQVNESDYSIYYVCVASAEDFKGEDDVSRVRITVPGTYQVGCFRSATVR